MQYQKEPKMLEEMKQNTTTNLAYELVGHYISSLTFQTADIPSFVKRALAGWDKDNIVGSLGGCIRIPGGFQWADTEFRAEGDDLLEVVVTFGGSFDSSDDGEEIELCGVRLSYAGIFRLNGELDDDAKKSCAEIVGDLMRDAVIKLMRLSGFNSHMFSLKA